MCIRIYMCVCVCTRTCVCSSYLLFLDNYNSFIDHFVFSCDFINMNMYNNLRVFNDNARSKVNLSDHFATAISLIPPVFYDAPNKRDSTKNHLLWYKASAAQIVEYQGLSD